MALVACVLLAGLLHAQESRATITGAITDPTQASVPGAVIEAKNLATGVSYRATTTDAGIYTIPLVPPGFYSLTATKDGFQRETQPRFEVRTGERVQLDLKLQIGSATQNISVTAEGPLLETATASRAAVLSTELVADVPVNGRTTTLMASLAPGVQLINDQPSQQNRPFDGAFIDRMTINGGRSQRNNYQINGISNFSQEAAGLGYANADLEPPPDSVQEVRVQTNDYSAEFGHTSGGTINVNLKSGTNQVHGTAYYFLQNTVFRANTFTNNSLGKPLAPFHWNQPGLQADGPVYIPKVYDGRNRTFWMFSWERIKDAIPTPGNFRTPTAREKAGDFSQTTVKGAPITIYDPTTRTPFPNDAIPSTQLNSVATAMLKYFPAPNYPLDASGNNFYPGSNPQTDLYDIFTWQFDQVITEKMRLTVTYGQAGRSQRQADNGIAEEASPDYYFHRNNRLGGIVWTDVLNPTTVLSVRGGYSRHLFFDNPTSLECGVSCLTGLGFPASLVSQLPLQGFPNIGFCADTACSSLGGAGNYLTIGSSTSFGGGYAKNYSNNFTLSASLTKTFGRHSIKFGGEFDNVFNNRVTLAALTLGFSPVFTQQNPTVNVATQGNAFADFLMGFPGLPNGAATMAGITPGVANNISTALGNHYYAAYIQDDWRVSSRLTLNLGLRWDYETPVTERYNRMNDGFNRSGTYTVGGTNFTGGLTFVGGGNRIPFGNDLNNFQPRIGAAYKVNDKTVLRGGFGLMYLNGYQDTGYYNGFSNIDQYIQSNNGNLTPANSLTNPFPNGLVQPLGSSAGLATLIGTGGINFSVTNRPLPNVKEFSFGVQHQLPAEFVLDLSYAGSRTRQLEVSSNINYLSTSDLAKGASVLNATVPNPFASAMPAGTPGAAATTTQQQLLYPFPQFFGTLTANNIPIGYAWYNALQARLERRLTKGLLVSGSLTYSKTMEAVTYLNPQDPDPSHSLDPSSFSKDKLARTITADDTPYRMRLSTLYQLPLLTHGKNPILRGILQGWQVNVIVTVQKGTPITAPSNAFSTGVAQSVASPTGAHYFNTCYINLAGQNTNCAQDSQPAWIQAPSFTLATLTPRMSNVRLSKPPNVDLSLFKSFTLYERLQLQVRAESYNLTNTAYFGAPNVSLTSAAFGTVSSTQTNDPRVEQLSLRILF